MHRGAAFLALLALTAALASQDPPAVARAFGLAKLADGSGWAGARIQLREAVGQQQRDPGACDQRTTLADDHGRFALDALTGVTYAAWAETDAGDGAVRFSEVVVEARTGHRIDLTAGTAATSPRTLHFEGLGDVEPATLRLELWDPRTGLDTAFPLDQDGRVTLPPRPEAPTSLRLRDPGGAIVLWGMLAASDSEVVRPAAMKSQRIVVHEANKNTPVAGARIAWIDACECVDLAVTDAKGEATITFPPRAQFADVDDTGGKLTPWLIVFAAGFDAGALATKDGRFESTDEKVPDGFDGICRLTARTSGTKSLHLLVDGEPLAGAAVRVTFDASHQISENSSMGVSSMRVLRTGPDGSIDVRGLIGDGDSAPVLLRLDDALRRRLGSKRVAMLPSWLPLWIRDWSEDTVSVDLVRDLRPLTVNALRASDGAPAPDLEFFLGLDALQRDHSFVGDHLGRARLLLPVGDRSPVRLGAIDRSGWCGVELDLHALATAPQPAAITLELQPVIGVHIELALPEGAEQPTHCWGYISLPQQLAGLGLIQFLPQGGLGLALTEPFADGALFRRLEDSAAARLFFSNFAGIEFDGVAATVYVPALPNTFTINGGCSFDGSYANGEANVELDGTEIEHRVRVEIAKN